MDRKQAELSENRGELSQSQTVSGAGGRGGVACYGPFPGPHGGRFLARDPSRGPFFGPMAAAGGRVENRQETIRKKKMGNKSYHVLPCKSLSHMGLQKA